MALDTILARLHRLKPGARVTILTMAVVGLAVLGTCSLLERNRAPEPEHPSQRVERQVREYGGAHAELRYAEPGLRRSVCGYIGRTQGSAAVGFVSTPTRIVFSDDPLQKEFVEMLDTYCPNYLETHTRR